MTTAAHAKAVRDYLDNSAGLSVPLKWGVMRSGYADDVVVCKASGGSVTHYLNGGGENSAQPTVQVMVRGAPDGYEAAHTRARTIHDTLKVGAITGYDGTWVQQAQPNDLGPDDDGRHYFTVNVRLLIDE